ncbi:MAG: hypothetical protein P8O16_02500 [Algoriphagus sp.]|uniref:hypothetical protein n=1 Tax=Algoriphagus sp. TaxID=1872435 RepID=UPI00261CAFCD|nr:hypothetical protein [Algoriphagus sp.]MDG1276122.1 hypothetical protein [Algoriphagus sp.]
MITQQNMLDYFLPIFEAKGAKYRKKSLIRAKKAVPGLLVVTKTSDGEETRNTAEEGDWLVENQTSSEEKYLIKPEIFESKYEMVHSLGEGWASYKPKGIMRGYEFTADDLKHFGGSDRLEFQAPWKDTMLVRTGDFLIIPPENKEIYRVARKEFMETYQEV